MIFNESECVSHITYQQLTTLLFPPSTSILFPMTTKGKLSGSEGLACNMKEKRRKINFESGLFQNYKLNRGMTIVQLKGVAIQIFMITNSKTKVIRTIIEDAIFSYIFTACIHREQQNKVKREFQIRPSVGFNLD